MAVRVKLWEDTFNRANGSIGSRYTIKLGSLQIVTNVVRPDAAGNYQWSVWSGTVPNRQYIKMTVPTIGVGTDDVWIMALREQSADDSAYWLFCVGGLGTTNNVRMYNRAAGVLNLLVQTTVAAAWVAGDTVEFEVDGNVLTAYRNGASVLSHDDTLATYPTGRVGFGFNLTGGAGDAELDNLEIGELRDAAPNFGAGTRVPKATDEFTGADSADIGATWDVYTGANNLQRVANRVRSGVDNTRCLEGYNGILPGANQYMGITIPTFVTNDFVFLWVRGAVPATAQSGYCALLFSGIPFVEIRRIDAGTLSAAVAGKDVQVVAGDTCYLEAEGQAVKLWVNAVKQVQWHDAANTYPTGRVGLGVNVPAAGGANIEMDSFVMGELSSGSVAIPQQRGTIRLGLDLWEV